MFGGRLIYFPCDRKGTRPESLSTLRMENKKDPAAPSTKPAPVRCSRSPRLERLRSNPDGTKADAVLKAGGVGRLVHTALLLPYAYFEACLGEKAVFSEAKKREVTFDDLQSQALPYLVDFIYEVDLPHDIPLQLVMELWVFATVHGMEDLVVSTETLLLARITSNNAKQVFRQAMALESVKVLPSASEALFGYLSGLNVEQQGSELSNFTHEEMKALQKGAPKCESDGYKWFCLVYIWGSSSGSHVNSCSDQCQCFELVRNCNLNLSRSNHLISLWKSMGDLNDLQAALSAKSPALLLMFAEAIVGHLTFVDDFQEWQNLNPRRETCPICHAVNHCTHRNQNYY
jgi:hypothetical protein